MLKNRKILIADDDETLCYLLKEELLNEGFQVDIVYDGKYAIERVQTKNYDLLLLDLEMKEIMGEEVLKFLMENMPHLQTIVLTAKSELRTAINCIKLGAYDFLLKPYEFQQLLITMGRALEHRDLVLKNTILTSKVSQVTPNKIIGGSPQIKEIIRLAERAAKSDSNILLEGETGTGKELFSEFVHQNSNRNEKPLVAINCASLPDQLIESELFGHERGAFTDAKTSKQGLFEIADGGTVFLDEIGELSLNLQPKLLRFLENGEFRRVGGVTNLSADVRVIGATNKNLLMESEKNNFRRDLLFRLNVITLTIPPLRDRTDDALLLANYFMQKKLPLRSQKKLSEDAEEVLLNYNYPGNVRELEHIIERAIIFCEGELITAKDLNLVPNMNVEESPKVSEGAIQKTLADMERDHIRMMLKFHEWSRENSARALGISQKTLYTKINKYNLRHD